MSVSTEEVRRRPGALPLLYRAAAREADWAGVSLQRVNRCVAADPWRLFEACADC